MLNNLTYYNTEVYFFGFSYVSLRYINDSRQNSEFFKIRYRNIQWILLSANNPLLFQLHVTQSVHFRKECQENSQLYFSSYGSGIYMSVVFCFKYL